MGINSSRLRTMLWELGGNDPRYRNFLEASGISGFVHSKKTLYDKLLYEHKDRMNQYRLFYKLFLGNHWENVSDENINPLAVNYCWYNIKKNAAFLMNKGFLVESDFPEIERFLQNNWKLNFGGNKENNLFGVNLAIYGGVFGDVWISVLNDIDKNTGSEYIKYEIINPLRSFPVVERKKMKAFLDYGEEKYIKKYNDGFAEYGNRREGFYYGKGLRKEIIDETQVGDIERYDYLDIPIVHFNNFPLIHSYYGLSDLSQVAELNLAYDKVLTDIGDIVDYHSSPITIITGAKGSDLVRGANKVWTLPEKATIKNLELNGDILAASNHLERLRKAISEVANVPENKVEHISNTSAAALAIQFMPLYETMEFKRIYYGSGILEMNYITLKYAFLKKILKPSVIIKNAIKKWEVNYKNEREDVKRNAYPFEFKITNPEKYDNLDMIYKNKLPKELYETYITWFPPLPRDEKSLADMAISLAKNHLWSRRHARSTINMSEKESRLMENEISEELKKNFEGFTTERIITNKVIGDNNKKNKTGLEGDPDIKGDKESIRQSNK